jgi:ribosomal protein RSM22 (predicted rRNA methylase)
MELPASLRQGVEALLEGTPVSTLREAGKILSARYRAEVRDGRLHMAGDLAVKAYLAQRLPATYAAVRAAMAAVAEAKGDMEPRTILDVGAGPGTALWAAADTWPSIQQAVLLEASAPARAVGERLAQGLALRCEWHAGDATLSLPAMAPADLVTACYLLDELAAAALPELAERLWALTAGTLLVVEPGTPAGWRRILDLRSRLIAAGGHVLAPCPHEAPCPLAAPDWCHFSRRVARSRLHRLAKEAEVPWEDEKFAYVAVSRHPADRRAARILAPPRTGSGKIALKLCQADGVAVEKLFTRRDADAFRAARRADWGDAFDSSA